MLHKFEVQSDPDGHYVKSMKIDGEEVLEQSWDEFVLRITPNGATVNASLCVYPYDVDCKAYGFIHACGCKVSYQDYKEKILPLFKQLHIEEES